MGIMYKLTEGDVIKQNLLRFQLIFMLNMLTFHYNIDYCCFQPVSSQKHVFSDLVMLCLFHSCLINC